MRPKPEFIVDWPWIIVRVSCSYCSRRGAFRLARIAEKYGAECGVERMRLLLAGDCPWAGEHFKPQKYRKGCGLYFPDLEGAPRPPDLPPAVGALIVIEGGKKRKAG